MNRSNLMSILALIVVVSLFAPVASADSCQELEKIVDSANSLTELKSRGQGLQIPEAELRRCQTALAQSPKLSQLMTQERQRLNQVSRSRQSTVSQRIKQPEQLPINRRALQLRGEAKTKLVSLRQISVRSIGIPPSTRGDTMSSGSPSISAVTPATLVPGTDVVIEGANFGNQQGTVTLKLQGKTFTAAINAWNDGWINAYLQDSIGGVQASDNAVISVQVPQAMTLNYNAPFIPLFVQKSAYEEYDGPGSLIFPNAGTATVFFNKHLKDGWKVTEFSVTAESGHGDCALGTPSMSVGGERVESQLKWSHDWWQGFAWCHIYVYAEGPQGISGGL